ncbi:MAG: cellulase family glycosylhydrolase [Marinagarivorans sp.]|nr:cellulase family glycosylhydrolase [Marinagarivorans sp.]
MSSHTAWFIKRKIIGSLLLSSAVALVSACSGTSSSSSATGGTTSSAGTTTSSTGTTASSSAAAISSNPIVASSSSIAVISSSSTATASSSSAGTSSPVFTSGTNGIFRVNPQGKVTKNGQVMPVRCGNWFGLEGQHEEAGGAPMELYIGNMWWDNTGRTLDKDMAEIKGLGFNTIRLPIAPQTLVKGHPDGKGYRDLNAPANLKGENLKNTYSTYKYADAYSAMIGFIETAKTANVNVMIDIHSCSNYVGWRAGRLDQSPPYVDKDRGADYKFTRENYSCGTGGPGVTVHAYNETKWLNDIKTIAILAKDHPNVIGIDIFNEPWDYSWDQWATLAEKAYKVIEENNPNILIFVQGISGGNSTNKEEPHGDAGSNPNWGENLYGFHTRPLKIPQDRLVISPHTYGPAVYQQMHFMDLAKDPTCEGLHGEEAAKHKCDMNMQYTRLKPGWEEHFGFLRDMGYAVVVGEWGGNRYWPTGGGARQAEADAWKHLTHGTGEANIDFQWQKHFGRYMKEEQIDSCYWGINPESSDTGGVFEHIYATDGKSWGKWGSVDNLKMNLIKNTWGL